MYEPRHIPASHRLSAWLLSALFALSLCVQQAWAAPAERTVIPLGQAVGIKLFADGVLVVALADGPTPARACGLRQGDIITAMDGAATSVPPGRARWSAPPSRSRTFWPIRPARPLSSPSAAAQTLWPSPPVPAKITVSGSWVPGYATAWPASAP